MNPWKKQTSLILPIICSNFVSTRPISIFGQKIVTKETETNTHINSFSMNQ